MPGATRTDVAIQGIRLREVPVSRSAGAGPSDDGHLLIDGVGAAIPLNPRSPYTIRGGRLLLDGADTGMAAEPVARPRFYDLATADGIPYEQIAKLHAAGVLATTVVQTCARYDEAERCRFCAIEESLRQGSTIAVKTPAMLAEVARAARRLDGVRQVVMTTGTSTGRDRGATHLARCVRAVAAAVPELPIQVQLEPPGDLASIRELYDAGARSIGIHVESLDDEVRRRWMPGKGSVPLTDYWAAWREAVRVFGRNEVSTYLLLGLGESGEELVAGCEELIEAGVYPFVVPFRPLAGTLATDVDRVPAPDPGYVYDVTRRVAAALRRAGMVGADQSAGCAACGACSALACEGRDVSGNVRTTPGGTVTMPWGPIPDQRGDVILTGTRAEPFAVREATAADRDQFRRLRHTVFVEEQGLFADSDLDGVDDDPSTVVLVARAADGTLIGGVRLHPVRHPAPDGRDIGWWRGSRLAVARSARSARGVGAALVRAACATAERSGALRFDALVQPASEKLFHRLGWRTRGAAELCGRPHVAMEWPIGRVQRLVDATKAALGGLVGDFGAPPGFVGDDGAPVPGSDLVAVCDAIVPSMVERDPEWAGWCSVLVNVNDLAAMGAAPVALLDAVAARDAAHARRILRGLGDASRAYDVPVVGGHTQLGVPAALSVTGLGRAAHPVPGGGGRPGHALRLTADLGGRWRPGYTGAQWDSTSYRTPAELRSQAGVVPSLAPAAAKDVSMSGLVGTAGMLAEASGCRAVLDVAAVPTPAPASTADWLCCFPGFAMITAEVAGSADPQLPAQLDSARCGELETGTGVGLRWPDGIVTEAVHAAVTGMGPA